MKTQIIISKGWILLKEYDFLITLTTNDVIEIDGREYRVDSCVLDIKNDVMHILLED